MFEHLLSNEIQLITSFARQRHLCIPAHKLKTKSISSHGLYVNTVPQLRRKQPSVLEMVVTLLDDISLQEKNKNNLMSETI